MKHSRGQDGIRQDCILNESIKKVFLTKFEKKIYLLTKSLDSLCES